MITFYNEPDRLTLRYSIERGSGEWVYDRLKDNGELILKRTFSLKKELLLNSSNLEDDSDEGIFDDDYFEFLFAKKSGNYYKVTTGIITEQSNVFFHEDIQLNLRMFVAIENVSIFGKIEDLINEEIYIGGNHPDAIPLSAFMTLVAAFPNDYERKKYVHARISSILRDYMQTTKDSEGAYNKYMNKKATKHGTYLTTQFKEAEILKYKTIYQKLKEMLNSELQYSEKQWQNEILDIILMLYPKYLYVFSEVAINDVVVGSRFLDFLLIDSDGHADIIEIKKPFDKCIITENRYRNNYIPLRELSGTVMQIEKYLYFLNRWATIGERELTRKYEGKLPSGFTIKLTNPSGMIIMGRDHNLNADQRLDFEVVKRKYKNVIDIITYDSLLQRIRATIDRMERI